MWLWTKHCNSISTRVVSITLGQPLTFKKLYNLIHIHSCKKKEKTHNLKCIKSLSNQIWTTTSPEGVIKAGVTKNLTGDGLALKWNDSEKNVINPCKKRWTQHLLSTK